MHGMGIQQGRPQLLHQGGLYAAYLLAIHTQVLPVPQKRLMGLGALFLQPLSCLLIHEKSPMVGIVLSFSIREGLPHYLRRPAQDCTRHESAREGLARSSTRYSDAP